MEPFVKVLLLGGSGVIFLWLTLRRLGIGRPDGKPDCGCGSGEHCSKKGNAR